MSSMGSTFDLAGSTESTQVLRALENPKYVWRTVDGLSREVGLPKRQITDVLSHIPSDVLVTTRSRKGQLFSTRRHYTQRQSTLSKILSVLTDSLK